jgi:4-hydroxy-3-methylbut-2-enyl diphosphate reductase
MILLAKNAGFCFGVKKAVEAVENNLGRRIVTLGPLIHNRGVVAQLEARGVRCVESVDEVLPGETVVIRSHGAAPEIYRQLEERGIEYIDATCPFVQRIHRRVYEAREEGLPVIIIGEAGHPEVDAVLGWAGENAYAAYTEEQLHGLPHMERAVVVAQTTITHEKWDDALLALQGKVDEVIPFMSICSATTERQKEAEEIAQKADTMIVVGGKSSSNTKKLYELCCKYCRNVYYVEYKDELSIEKKRFGGIIGIVAGASTPDTMIREVFDCMSENEKVLTAEGETLAEGGSTVSEAVETSAEAELPIVEDEKAAMPESSMESQDTIEEPIETAAADNAPEAAPKPSAPATEHEEFLESIDKVVRLKKGQMIKGSVVQVTDEDVSVNIGSKSDAIIHKNEISMQDVNPKDLFKVGDEIEAEVISLNDGEGNILLSRKRVEKKLNWTLMQENVGTEKLYKCTIRKAVKGGVTTKIEGYSAFIPASHLSLKYVEDLKQFEGKEIEVTLIDADKRQERLVASHKSVLMKEKQDKEQELWNNFVKGSRIKGVVKRLTDFGAFVDVGGVDGLLHISDLAWSRVKHPSDVVSEGQELELLVLNVDPAKKKIALGYKQLQAKPWEMVPEKYQVGDIVKGKVVRIVPFGAFVQLEPTVDGLIHISQIAPHRLEKVEDALRVGDVVEAKILEINAEKHKISLSRKALLAVEEKPVEKKEETTNEEDFRYELPPIQESTVSLADFFPKKDE